MNYNAYCPACDAYEMLSAVLVVDVLLTADGLDWNHVGECREILHVECGGCGDTFSWSEIRDRSPRGQNDSR